MQTISLDDIVIENSRVRHEFDVEYIDELRASILDKGLFHAPLLKRDGRTLVAGECRIRAIRSLYGSGKTFRYNGEEVPANTIPYTTLGDLSDFSIREAEIEENIKRRDLTWQERINAISDLHAMRVEQNPKQTHMATAEEILGDKINAMSGVRLVRNAQIIAKHMDDPDVRKAPDERTAFKIISKKLTNEAAAKRAEGIVNTTPHTLICSPCEGPLLSSLPEGKFDLIITDPPYGREASSFGTGQTHEYEDDRASAMKLYDVLANGGYRVTKPAAHLLTFIHVPFFEDLYYLFGIYGWKVFPTPLIWVKGSSANTQGHFPWPDHGPRRCYEGLLFAVKGNKPLVSMFADVANIPPVQDKHHPAEKPVELYTYYLRNITLPGSEILDPFCGSGTIFPAASSLKMIATGIEKNAQTYKLANARLQGTWDAAPTAKLNLAEL
jgi:site-specific DNA-methyltransferase (adenine-specific)